MRKIDRTGFGQRLYDARKAAKLSQEQLAKMSGLAQSTLAELERRGQGSARTLQLAAACGVSPLWLAEEKGDRHLPAATPRNSTQSEPPGYSAEALALAWLLDQVPRRLDKVRANSAATAAILHVLHGLDVAPTDTPSESVTPAKRSA